QQQQQQRERRQEGAEPQTSQQRENQRRINQPRVNQQQKKQPQRNQPREGRYPARPVVPPASFPPPVMTPVWLSIPKAVAFFLGLLTLLNLFGSHDTTPLSASFWWIDLRLWSPQMARGLMGVAAVIFLLFAAVTNLPRYLRTVAMIVVITLLLVSVKNSYSFYQQLNNGEIYSTAFFPASLYTALLLLFVLAGLLVESGVQKNRGIAFLLGAITFVLCVVGFPLAQMYCEGKTDYRRATDVAVVFQNQTKGDKNPARTLEEQMQTACELYKTELVSKLILSGGLNKEDEHHTTLMQQYAIKQGVPKSDIILDKRASNQMTSEDIKRVTTLIAKKDSKQTEPFLIVTHFYQQPRIQLNCKRQSLVAYTVPAKETSKITLLNSPIPYEALQLWMTWLDSFFRQ
ncbi:hypothetical protein MNBD_PLANCTO02-810, partial [hydrothermal vent metagenome]